MEPFDQAATIAKKNAERAKAKPAEPEVASSFTPFRPATTAFEALDNAFNGYTPEGEPRILPAALGQAQAMLDRALAGESGVGVRLRPVLTTSVVVPVVVDSLEDQYGELDDAHCLPIDMLDFDLTADGLRPKAIGRFAKAKDPFAVVLAMMGCGWIESAAVLAMGKPKPDIGLQLPTEGAKLGILKAKEAAAILLPLVPPDDALPTEQGLALRKASATLAAAIETLDRNAAELDKRIHEPARLKGGSFTPVADEWVLDRTRNGTAVACSLGVEEVFALWQAEKAKTTGTVNAGAGGNDREDTTAPSTGKA